MHSEASAYWTSGVVCLTHCVGVGSSLCIFEESVEILACLCHELQRLFVGQTHKELRREMEENLRRLAEEEEQVWEGC